METEKLQETEIEQSLGEQLRNARLAKDQDLHALSQESKISLSNLQAMEADDFSSLPPVAFARGLYTIYAKTVGLNTEEILKKFEEETSASPDNQTVKPTPSRLVKEVGTMAEAPSGRPTSLFGIGFIVSALLIAAVCWYYSINPASFISQKLRGLEKQENQVAQQSDESTETQALQKYTLAAEFQEDVTFIITLDDNLPIEQTVVAGQKQRWSATKSIELGLPEQSKALFTLNDQPIVLPEPEDGRVLLLIPEILFE